MIPASDYTLDPVAGSVRAFTKDNGAGSSEMLMVDPGLLNVMDGFNVRITDIPEYAKGIEVLARSIATEGFYRHKPFTAFVGKSDDDSNTMFITDGHRRFAALEWLRENEPDKMPERVPVIVLPNGTSSTDMIVALFKTGEPLTPLETAINCKRLIGLGVEEEEIANRAGITKRYLSELLTLVAAPKKIINAVAAGKISATLAVQQIKANGKEAAKKIEGAIETATKRGKNKATQKDVDATERAAGTDKSAAAPKRGKWVSEKIEYEGKAGDTVAIDTIRAFSAFNAGDWYDLTDEKGTVVLTKGISVKMTVKTLDPPPSLEEAAADL
jgi:ParB-like chromosome segregation protein Spo0J